MKFSRIILLLSCIATIYAFNYPIGEAVVQKSFEGNLSIAFGMTAGEPAIEHFTAEEGDFVRLGYSGAYPSGEVGAPELPVLRVLIQVPFGSTPRVDLGELHTTELSLSEFGPVTPRRAPWVKLPGFRSPFEMDEATYSRDSYQFDNRVEIIDISTARSFRLALVEVRPVDYNPVAGTISIASDLSFEVHFDNADLGLTRRIKERYENPYYSSIVKPFLANPEAFSSKWLPAEASLGYLIVSGNAYADSARILAEWKQRLGYSVKHKTVGELGGTAVSIRSWILAEYDTSEIAPTFVLLVGDIADVPSFTGRESDTETDLPYGDLDADGYIPELFVGRISPANSAGAAHFIRRGIKYEQFDIAAGHRDFADKASFLASDDASFYELAQETQRYVISEHFAPAGFYCDSIWSWGNPSAGTQSIAAIRDGRTILSYSGHGGYYLWDAPAWSQDDVRGLGNIDEYPFVISNACITGTFSLDECFGETWIRQNNAGAIGFIGASNNSYWDEDDVMERVMFDDVFRAGYRFAAGYMNRGLLGVYLAYPSDAEYYYDIYNLLGDPALAIWLRQPAEMTAAYPPMLSVGGIVSVNVTSGGAPVDSALVCASDGRAVHSVGYTNASGNIALSVAGAGMGDTIWVTASHYDMIPHLGFAIIGGGGPWLALDSVVLDDSAGDSDGIADIGEEVALTVFIKNIGGETASSVSGVLRAGSSDAEVSDSAGSFGTIPEGAWASNATPFVVEFSPSIPDGRLTAFTLFASDLHDSSWTVPLGIRVNAPILSIVGHTMNDDLGGDGNGFLEPGESSEITFELNNSGGEAARFIAMNLALSPNPYVTVSAASSGIDSVASGETRSNAPAFELVADPSCPNPFMVELYVTARDSRGPQCVDTIIIAVGTAGFVMNCEDGPLGWISDGVWNLGSHRWASPSNSWYSGVEGRFSYRDTIDPVLYSPEVAAPINAELSFYHYFDTESRYDSCRVHYTTNGGTSWNLVASFDGPSKGWSFQRYNLASMLTPGVPVKFRFMQTSDVYCNGEGWYLDDIELSSPKALYLGGGGVQPFAGSATTDFKFSVLCMAPSGGIPSSSKVVINGIRYGMIIADGSVAGGARFEYTGNLPPNEYSYHFEFVFAGDTIRFPERDEIEGPYVDEAFQTFDVGSSTAGITHYGAFDNWQWGVPTSGPGFVPVGSNCWATRLASDYSDSARSRLELPALDLDGFENAFLCFHHWYRFQSSDSYSFHDGGNIKISVDGADTFVVHPQGGYDGTASQYNRFVSWESCFGGSDNGNFWQFEAIDLTPWVGHSVKVFFDFGSSTRTTDAGWYINNLYLYGKNPHGIEATGTKLPESFSLFAHPNPFNSAVEFEANIPALGAKLRIFDINGRLVADLSEGLEPGVNLVRWNPKDEPSGVYFAKISHGGSSRTLPVVYLK